MNDFVFRSRGDDTETEAFLERAGWGGASHTMLAADASFRQYERVTHHGKVAVLMDAPKPWEDVERFIRVTELLRDRGVNVPEILARDVAHGYLLLEDFGDASFTRLLRQQPEREAELYAAATDALISLHLASQRNVKTIADTLGVYNYEKYLQEVALFSDWFLPQVHGVEKARALREEYLAIWAEILSQAKFKQTCIVHRDYHADNLFWLEGKHGVDAVGMIDYQDALLGDPAYDLASLLEDARRDVSDTIVADCFARYSTEIGEPAQAFAARYCVIAAQRNAKIIGIFTRLCVRDGKAQYLDYLPRVWGHFMNDLNHPLMAPLRAFVEKYVPQEWRGSFTPKMDLDYTKIRQEKDPFVPITHAIILAAGLGTRMRPLTDTLPKPLIPVYDNPLISYACNWLSSDARIPHIVINTSYRAQQLEDYMTKTGIATVYSTVSFSREEPMPLETGGGIAKALPLLGEGPFIAMNSDAILLGGRPHPIQHMRQAWHAGLDFLMLVVSREKAVGWSGNGDFIMDDNGRLRRPKAGEDAPYIFTGVEIIHPRVFANCPSGAFSLSKLWNERIGADGWFDDRIRAVAHDGPWVNVGDLAGLEVAEKYIRKYYGVPDASRGSVA